MVSKQHNKNYVITMNNKLTKWAFWLSIIAIVLSVALIVLWVVSTAEMAVVQLDTFVGVIVSLMALLVTIVLGWQIYNAVEVKEKIQAINTIEERQEQLKKYIEQSQENIKNSNIYNAFYHSTMMGLGAFNAKEYTAAFRFLLNALALSLQCKEPIELRATLDNLSNIVEILKVKQSIQAAKLQEIENVNKTIRESKWYKLCREEYEVLYVSFMAKIQVAV